MAELPDEARTEVARRIATMTAAMPESITVVAQQLRQRSAAVIAPHAPSDQIGGVQSVVDIINRADVKEEKHLPQSMMPAGLAAGLTVEEFTSLIEYLGTLKSIGG